jgi:hypothetical protein
MNSPVVIELARRLVAAPDFAENPDDHWRLNYLYERIYQRPPSPEETGLGLEFVNQTPLRDDPPPTLAGNFSGDGKKNKLGKKNRLAPAVASSASKNHAPLTSWEEYAQALLQANETSFVN